MWTKLAVNEFPSSCRGEAKQRGRVGSCQRKRERGRERERERERETVTVCQWEWVYVIVDAFQQGHNRCSRSVAGATMQLIWGRNTQLIWCQVTKWQVGAGNWPLLGLKTAQFCILLKPSCKIWIMNASVESHYKTFFFSVLGVSTASKTEVGSGDVKTPWRCWFVKLKICLPLLQHLYWNHSSRQWLQSLEKSKWLFWWSWPRKPGAASAVTKLYEVRAKPEA